MPSIAKPPSDRRADVAFAVTVLLCLLTLVAFGVIQRRLEMIGGDDFSRIWAGPRAVVLGHDPYDPAAWPATAQALGTLAPDTAVQVYPYPPWVVLVLLPLGLLPLPIASLVWLIASLTAGTAGLHALLREYLPGRPGAHALAAAMLLLSWVGLLTVIIGQWGFLLIGGLCAIAVSLRSRRPIAAGLAAVALAAKPQLFVFAAPALALHAAWPAGPGRIRRGGPRFVGVAVGAGALLLVASSIILPSWWPNWLRFAGSTLTPDSDTIPALLLAVGGDGALRAAPVALLALVAIGLCFHPRSEAWLPVWLALSSAGVLYSNSYDQILLIVPIVMASGIAVRRSRGASWVVLGLGAFVLLVVTPLMYELALRRHSETYGVLVPLAVFVVIVVALWPLRRARPAASVVEYG
jgi:glycosyl transferase family 87